MSHRPHERSHRLSRERYLGEITVAFTTCIEDRKALFVDERPTARFASILQEEASKRDCHVLIACFMPDHLHTMMLGKSAGSDVLGAFYRFKLRIGILLHRFHQPIRWQKDFYDHVVRADGDWRRQAKYIALNPVRGKIIEDPFDYGYIYSSLGTKEEVLAQLFWD